MHLAALIAALLPAVLAPSAPFPAVTSAVSDVHTIAPGIAYGDYRLTTAGGPIAVHAIAVAPHRSDVRFNTVLASDALTSNGETVSSMARRTGAVGGINGDYFDIGNTYRPTNIVVSDGSLIRTPRKRYALIVTKSGVPQIAETSFLGQAQVANRTVTLDAINEFPPPGGGVSLITPAFGTVPALSNGTLIALAPQGGTPPFGEYRVTAIADNTQPAPAGFYLAVGLNAYANAGVPDAGDLVTITGDLSPIAAADVAAAVGGGPLILNDGRWYDDPDGPRGGEYALRIPASGAATAPDGTLFLIEVDGRQHDVSIGVTRPEFAALMRAFGASQGMAFDGGGSSAQVARPLGSSVAQLVTSPSDGLERPVADGMFVYSTAPAGPATQLIGTPDRVRALAGAPIPVRIAALDDAEHVRPSGNVTTRVEPASLGTFENGTFVGHRAGDGTIVARSGTLVGRIPVHVVSQPARVVIEPDSPNVTERGTIVLRAHAYDERGFELALPAHLSWRASTGTIDGTGTYTAGTQNAVVSLLIGDRLASTRVSVGSHTVPMPLVGKVRFMTIPQGGDGHVGQSAACRSCVELQYQLDQGTRAAYAVTDRTLPLGTIGVEFDASGSGDPVSVKVALRNAINEEVLLSAVPALNGARHHAVVRFPAQFAQPGRLVAIYVIMQKGQSSAAGTLLIDGLKAIVAGSH